MLVQTSPATTAETTPWALEPFTNYLPLQSIDTFHYSKTFQANLGINPLTASAAPLFILLAKLQRAHQYDDIACLQRHLIHEVRAFECHAIAKHYHPNAILAARYAIVAALDETINRTEWGQTEQWSSYSLTRFFYCEQSEQEFLFSFLKSLINAENTPLDLLEFCYLCLNLGFVGTHRKNSSEFEQIQKITNDLYALIKQRKVVKKITPKIDSLKYKPQSKKSYFSPPWWLLSTVSLVICISIYFGFNYIMSVSTKPTYAKLDQIIHEATTEFS